MRRRLAALLLLTVAAGCGGTSSVDDPFAYDANQPLRIENGARVPANERVVVQGLTYASGDDRVEAYLVRPRAQRGSMPAVVFLHGAGGDRDFAFATELAERALRTLAAAAPDGTRVRWYAADHALNTEAERERLEWLVDRLELAG